LTRLDAITHSANLIIKGKMARAPAEQKTADEIIGQLEALDASNLGRIIEAATSLRATKQAAERDAFIARVREEAAAIGFRPEDLFAPAPPAVKKASTPGTRKRGVGTVPAQFRGPNGEEWSGRGKSPKWLAEADKAGRSREEFRIKENQPDLMEQARREHGEA
jgi:DNA-binding protein H-NS